MKRLLWGLLLVGSVAVAGDRHVFLDTDSDGILNSCPNPSHNHLGIASNTADMTYCADATLLSSLNRIICDSGSCASWTTTTGACTGPSNPSGNVANVTNGVALQLDADAAYETVYGHPQACVYNMAQSDSCEIHAGTYRKPGAYVSENGLSGDGQSDGSCGRSNCWKSTVVAFGIGPNLTGNAYGTEASPAYLRGAVLNGSTDTWDSNDNKRPDSTESINTYAPIFSGDIDADGAFDRNITSGGATDVAVAAAWNVQSGAGFTGDSHYAIIVGCGDPGYNRLCRTSMPESDDWIRIDTNADGNMDTIYGQVSASSPYPATNYFYTKDIEFTRYNGGDGTPGSSTGLPGIRQMGGHITMHGNKMATGLDIDKIYVHDNDYSICAGAGTGCETMWSVFHDQENSGCLTAWEIKNSLLYQNNEKLFNDDCGSGSECGCGMNIHDNRIVVDISSSVRRGDHTAMFYVKGIDTIGEEAYGTATSHKEFAFWNNEVIFLDFPTYKFHDLQSFGNMRGEGRGEFWIYGNLFRLDPASNDSAGSQVRFEVSFDSGQAGTEGSWKYYLFSNTYDFSSEQMDTLTSAGGGGTRLVERNNAYFNMRDVHATSSVTTISRASEVCSVAASGCTTASTTRTVWFTPGSFTTGNPTLWNGLTNYVPLSTGAAPIYENGSCDPDGDGTAGVDYDRDGDNDLLWDDIAGNAVICSTTTTAISIGAIQPNDDEGAPSCGNNTRELTEVCDGTDLNSQTCITQGFTTGTLACAGDCASFNTSGCSSPTPERANKRGVIKRGVKMR